MKRRSFFAALASLPFVGRFAKKPAPVMSGDWEINAPLHQFSLYYDGERSWATVDGEAREVPLGTTRASSPDGRTWTFSNDGQGASVHVVPGFDVVGARRV